jgi:hypothetical protein
MVGVRGHTSLAISSEGARLMSFTVLAAESPILAGQQIIIEAVASEVNSGC